MVGGDDADVRAVQAVFERLGSRIVHQGGPGAGQHTKLVNQILIASTMVGVCEGLVYAERAGLDPTRVIESVGAGAAGSWSINELGPRIVAGDMAPGFFIDHFLKDLRIALDEAAHLGVAAPGLALARQLYEAARAQGLGQRGTQALALVITQLAGPDHS
jgi:3-hydroxyisobutyrate dehydrogenase